MKAAVWVTLAVDPKGSLSGLSREIFRSGRRRLRPSSWCKLRGGHQLRKSGRGQFGEGRFITGGHAGHGLKRQVTML